MELPEPDRFQDIREGMRDLCGGYPDAYWREVDARRGYPEDFVDALTKAGWLAALIPQEYGGSGLGLAEASVIMEEINRNGGNAGACHGQMYNMGTLLRHGSDEQKRHYLPRIASGELRLQSMGVTEPTTGTDTTRLRTTAVRKGERYVVNGQKVWISRIQHSDLMILLARTTPLSEVRRKSDGMSIFLVDLHHAIGHGMTVRPIANMVNHETNELFFDNLEIPVEQLIGEELDTLLAVSWGLGRGLGPEDLGRDGVEANTDRVQQEHPVEGSRHAPTGSTRRTAASCRCGSSRCARIATPGKRISRPLPRRSPTASRGWAPSPIC